MPWFGVLLVGGSMRPLQQHITTRTDNRLTAVIDAAANLKAQLFELERLREQVAQALLSAGKSPQLNRWNGTARYRH